MEELKPCPFCGGGAHIKEVVSAYEMLYTVGCSDSECMGFETLYCRTTMDDAAEAWNRRADECDRDALLALADEMDRRQRDVATAATDGVVDVWCLREYADLIREACGEAVRNG